MTTLSRCGAEDAQRLGWTSLLVDAGVLEDVRELGGSLWQSEPPPGALPVTIAAHGPVATDVARDLADELGLAPMPVATAVEPGLLVVLQDAVAPRRGTLSCDMVIPRSLVVVDEAWREASGDIATAHIESITLRCGPIGSYGTLLSVLIAPGADPAVVVSQLVEHLGTRLVA